MSRLMLLRAGPRALLALSLLAFVGGASGGCKKGPTWREVLARYGPPLEAIRKQLPAVQAAIDAAPVPQPGNTCQPSPAFVHRPKGTDPGHNTDFLEYARVASGGASPPSKAVALPLLLPSTPLTRGLQWTHPSQNLRLDEPVFAGNVDTLERASRVKALVVVKERPGASTTGATVDSYLVQLDPVKVVCAFTVEAKGRQHDSGMPESTVRVRTYKGSQLVGDKVEQRGGVHTEDVTLDLRGKLLDAAKAQLGFELTSD